MVERILSVKIQSWLGKYIDYLNGLKLRLQKFGKSGNFSLPSFLKTKVPPKKTGQEDIFP